MPGLPNDANLEHLRGQARDLQRAVRAGDVHARELLATHHPAPPADLDSLPLSAAQLAVARGYGFASWPKLRHFLDDAATLTRDPTVDPDPSLDGAGDLADQFCRLACLVYSEVDDPARWARANVLLQQHPELVRSSVAAAAAAADVDAIRSLLAADPDAANRPTGPHRWAPLLYLSYSRALAGTEPAGRFLATAQELISAGADVNAGYLWRGLPSPFTVLTGVFGEGEQGAGKQPRHPQSIPLARLLLTNGADPNDGQALYNRMFRPDNSHLELLFDFGLGRGDGGPWRRRLGDAMESPAQMLARQVGWAIDHGFVDRLALLIEHGVDVAAPLADGRTPLDHAIAGGRLPILELLRSTGVDVPPMSAEQQVIAALLAPDPARGVATWDPAVLAAVRSNHPDLVHRADSAAAIELLAQLGFDLNAGRGGVTALHDAAFRGDVELIGALLAGGADPTRRDAEHQATPLAWAQYACQPEAIELLTGVTPD
ncbi:MAG: ankyrin repeat domain-containing protein [Nakamurella sp.]